MAFQELQQALSGDTGKAGITSEEDVIALCKMTRNELSEDKNMGDMQKANDFNQLNLPEKYLGFLHVFLSNIASVDNDERVILFGGCEKGRIHSNSHVDLFIVTKKAPTLNEEVYIMADCPPDYENEYYLQSDIIINIACLYVQP